MNRLIFSLALLLAGCSQTPSSSPAPTSPAPAPTVPATSPGSSPLPSLVKSSEPKKISGSSSPKPFIIDASNSDFVAQGQIRVHVEKVSLRRVLYNTFGDPAAGATSLAVALLITNLSENQRRPYKGWGLDAGIWDNFDNEYSHFVSSFGQQISEQVQGTIALYPGKPVQDILFFEVPVDKAETLSLILPGDNIGIDRPIVFILSKGLWDAEYLRSHVGKVPH